MNKWYREKLFGKTMERPGWKRLEADMVAGKVPKIVVWRLDRLGRTAAGLTALFEDLQRRKIGFESLRDKVDLTPTVLAVARVLRRLASRVLRIANPTVSADPGNQPGNFPG